MKTFLLGFGVLVFLVLLNAGFFFSGLLRYPEIMTNAPLWVGLTGSLGVTLNFFISLRNRRKKDIAENFIPALHRGEK